MTGDGVGGDAQRLPQTDHGIFDREQRWLGKQRLIESPGVGILRNSGTATEHLFQVDPLGLALPLPALAGRIQDAADVDVQMRLEQARAAIHLLPEHGPGFVEVVRHAGVVIADTGQQEDHRAPWFVRAAGNDTLRVSLTESGDGILAVDADEAAAVRERLASDAQGVGHVAHVHGVVLDQELPQTLRRQVESRGGLRRHQQHVRRTWLSRRGRLGRFLED